MEPDEYIKLFGVFMELHAPDVAREMISLGTRGEIIGYLWMTIDIHTSNANGARFSEV